MICRITLIFILCAACFDFSRAQEALAFRISPLAIVSARYKETYLKITYSQPFKEGRTIFGALVPYGKVWETGANEDTEITITTDIAVSGKNLKAGTYSLFTIPEKDHWTIIINSDVGQWGAYNYNSKLDVMRFDVPVEPLDQIVYEPFTIVIEQKTDTADIAMMWDKTRVSFPVRFIETK